MSRRTSAVPTYSGYELACFTTAWLRPHRSRQAEILGNGTSPFPEQAWHDDQCRSNLIRGWPAARLCRKRFKAWRGGLSRKKLERYQSQEVGAT
jgi:hypothetical protein